jgi:hypothetical protein
MSAPNQQQEWRTQKQLEKERQLAQMQADQLQQPGQAGQRRAAPSQSTSKQLKKERQLAQIQAEQLLPQKQPEQWQPTPRQQQQEKLLAQMQARQLQQPMDDKKRAALFDHREPVPASLPLDATTAETDMHATAEAEDKVDFGA